MSTRGRRAGARGRTLLLTLALAGCDVSPGPDALPAIEPLADVVPTDAPSSEPARSSSRRQPGVVLSREEIDVRPPTSARIVEVSVRPGDTVAAGDVLARLDTSEAEADLRIAEADLRALRGERKALQLALDAARDEREATDTLRQQGFVSDHEADDAALEAGRTRATLAGVDARLRGLEARVARVRSDMEEQWLRAPIGGIVAARLSSAGERVDPSSVVVRLLAVDAMSVRFAVDPAERSQYHAGQPIRVLAPELDSVHAATIRSVAPEVDPAAHQVFIDAALDDPALALPVGLAVWVEPG